VTINSGHTRAQAKSHPQDSASQERARRRVLRESDDAWILLSRRKNFRRPDPREGQPHSNEKLEEAKSGTDGPPVDSNGRTVHKKISMQKTPKGEQRLSHRPRGCAKGQTRAWNSPRIQHERPAAKQGKKNCPQVRRGNGYRAWVDKKKRQPCGQKNPKKSTNALLLLQEKSCNRGEKGQTNKHVDTQSPKKKPTTNAHGRAEPRSRKLVNVKKCCRAAKHRNRGANRTRVHEGGTKAWVETSLQQVLRLKIIDWFLANSNTNPTHTSVA